MGAQQLYDEMRLQDIESFFNYFRMTPESFDNLLQLVGSSLTKGDVTRTPIHPSVKLQVTLRFLASGDSQTSLAYAYRLGKSTTCTIISNTLDALWHFLRKEVLSEPTEENWLKVAAGFKARWNFPNVIGAIDGKHIRIKAPPDSGSSYYNYKNFFSIILLAVADYRYRFVIVDVGAQGRQSDGGVLQNSIAGIKLATRRINVPAPKEIYPGGPILPFYLLGDEAFGLKPWLITPYSGKGSANLDYCKLIFNYRQSRARRIIENVFGVLVARWRILTNPSSALCARGLTKLEDPRSK